ncbi:hypothetical protein [Agaribacterium sp. ZY112]|uniref:hypothetical protein n=1 Tax=Agaribacterium sp. ZY112 TaxID=3233574 RepID=UPI003524CA4D
MELQFTQLLYLVALYSELPIDKTTFSAQDVLKKRIAPTQSLKISMLNSLIECGAILIHTKDNRKVKVLNGTNLTTLKSVTLLNENSNQRFREMLNTLKEFLDSNDKERLDNLKETIQVHESIEFIFDKMDSFSNLYDAINLEPPEEILAIMAECEPRETLMLLWRACQSMENHELRLLSASDDPSDILKAVSQRALNYLQGYSSRGASIKKFCRRNYRKSAISTIVFEHL